MISLYDFKQRNCSDCYYNGSLGMKGRMLFCAYAGKIMADLERGICHTRTAKGKPYMIRG